ncbi:MAG: translesion DNA synthesis-associated protein ImuA [Leptospirillia bacterium]
MIPESLQGRADLWQGHGAAMPVAPGIPTGIRELDDRLPWGGWPHSLTEILPEGEGIGELRLLLPALSALTRQGQWLAWINPPYVPYAPALSAGDVDLSRMMLVQPDDPLEALWAAEEALRSPVCGAVLFWPGQIDDKRLRRLQRAAEAGNTWAVLFRESEVATTPSPARLRLRLSATADGLNVQLLKCPGTPPCTLRLTFPDAA